MNPSDERDIALAEEVVADQGRNTDQLALQLAKALLRAHGRIGAAYDTSPASGRSYELCLHHDECRLPKDHVGDHELEPDVALVNQRSRIVEFDTAGQALLDQISDENRGKVDFTVELLRRARRLEAVLKAENGRH